MADVQTAQVKNTKNKALKKDYVAAVGRRREAVARVRVYSHVKDDLVWADTPVKKGEILVNQRPIAEYFSSDVERHLYTEPLRITNAHQQQFAITVKVTGGGHTGQLQAVIAGLANALNKLDTVKYRPILKKKGFLTRDSRIRQRRNVGMGGKSRRKRQSPKR